jgi:hypothetical protein
MKYSDQSRECKKKKSILNNFFTNVAVAPIILKVTDIQTQQLTHFY